MKATRYYITPAKDKSLEDCENHGMCHKAYGWMPQIGYGWNKRQIAAYMKGYNETKKENN